MDNEAENQNPEQAPETETADDAVLKLEGELKSAKDQLLRALAEAENARRRVEKEKEESLKYANANFARDILNVSDNLRRALDTVKKDEVEANPALKNLMAGVEITEKELLTAFEKHGIKKIEPKIGETFDYNKHQAMFEAENAPTPPGTVMQVMQPGYIIHDRLLRPALVGVAKAAANDGKSAKVDVQA